jgi:hypothetical protein
MDGRVGKRGDSFLLQPQHDLDVERLARNIVHAFRAVAEADDVDACRRDQFEKGFLLDQPGEIAGLRDVLVDQAAELLDAMLLERHPDLQARKPRVVCRPYSYNHSADARPRGVDSRYSCVTAKVPRCAEASRIRTQPTSKGACSHL